MDEATIGRTVRMAINALEGRDPATTNVIPFPVRRRPAVPPPDPFVEAFRRIRAAHRAGLPVPEFKTLLNEILVENGESPLSA